MQAQGILPTMLPVHILAGVLALVSGYIALYAAKGATLHRKSGMNASWHRCHATAGHCVSRA